jgi:hypothetical protein
LGKENIMLKTRKALFGGLAAVALLSAALPDPAAAQGVRAPYQSPPFVKVS